MIWAIAEIEDGLSLQVEHCSGYTFYSDSGLHNGGQGSVHERESYRQGSVFVAFVSGGGHQRIRCGKEGHCLFS